MIIQIYQPLMMIWPSIRYKLLSFFFFSLLLLILYFSLILKLLKSSCILTFSPLCSCLLSHSLRNSLVVYLGYPLNLFILNFQKILHIPLSLCETLVSLVINSPQLLMTSGWDRESSMSVPFGKRPTEMRMPQSENVHVAAFLGQQALLPFEYEALYKNYPPQGRRSSRGLEASGEGNGIDRGVSGDPIPLPAPYEEGSHSSAPSVAQASMVFPPPPLAPNSASSFTSLECDLLSSNNQIPTQCHPLLSLLDSVRIDECLIAVCIV